MPCDTSLKPNQTIKQRADEIIRAVGKIQAGLIKGRVKAKVGPQGAVAFEGITDEERDGLTDACIYRRIMATGAALAKMEITKAEQLAGRTIDRRVVAHGVHSHDGGRTWHNHKG